MQQQSQQYDVLRIGRIREYGYTGVLPEEKSLGQMYEVDVEAYLDIRRAAETDDLQYTFDYSKTVPQIKNLIRTSKVDLIETLATNIGWYQQYNIHPSIFLRSRSHPINFRSLTHSFIHSLAPLANLVLEHPLVYKVKVSYNK
eukprot:GEZU01024883.1.p1 GENE.GEZU01024883.1~~GEZU01024883.1.p1  ORF type:complete len:143 (+),score=16.78 GEZU01024883.1:209-637(+)